MGFCHATFENTNQSGDLPRNENPVKRRPIRSPGDFGCVVIFIELFSSWLPGGEGMQGTLSNLGGPKFALSLGHFIIHPHKVKMACAKPFHPPPPTPRRKQARKYGESLA